MAVARDLWRIYVLASIPWAVQWQDGRAHAAGGDLGPLVRRETRRLGVPRRGPRRAEKPTVNLQVRGLSGAPRLLY